MNDKLWTMDYGRWTMEYGRWTMDYGLWIMDYGLWTMDYGLWTMDYGRIHRASLGVRPGSATKESREFSQDDRALLESNGSANSGADPSRKRTPPQCM